LIVADNATTLSVRASNFEHPSFEKANPIGLSDGSHVPGQGVFLDGADFQSGAAVGRQTVPFEIGGSGRIDFDMWRSQEFVL
jgi:hypothetical protein